MVPSLNGLGDTPPQHLVALLQAVQAKQVKAIFSEASVPDASVRTVAREGESLAAGARRLLEHLATAGPSGPADPGRSSRGRDAPPAEEFHLTDEGKAVLDDPQRP